MCVCERERERVRERERLRSFVKCLIINVNDVYQESSTQLKASVSKYKLFFSMLHVSLLNRLKQRRLSIYSARKRTELKDNEMKNTKTMQYIGNMLAGSAPGIDAYIEALNQNKIDFFWIRQRTSHFDRL